MLGCFTAYESTAGSDAAFCNARYYGCYLFGIVFSASDVIKEEKRFCTTADNVVYAHCNAVYAYGVVFV